MGRLSEQNTLAGKLQELVMMEEPGRKVDGGRLKESWEIWLEPMHGLGTGSRLWLDISM
jgi:hypothetical protein